MEGAYVIVREINNGRCGFRVAPVECYNSWPVIIGVRLTSTLSQLSQLYRLSVAIELILPNYIVY